jgi:hypothetical protein
MLYVSNCTPKKIPFSKEHPRCAREKRAAHDRVYGSSDGDEEAILDRVTEERRTRAMVFYR